MTKFIIIISTAACLLIGSLLILFSLIQIINQDYFLEKTLSQLSSFYTSVRHTGWAKEITRSWFHLSIIELLIGSVLILAGTLLFWAQRRLR